jgi:SCF-associated factor 1
MSDCQLTGGSGWSTTLLTSQGTLHTVGVLDGLRVFAAIEHLAPLGFPAGYPSSSENAQYEEPAIAIRQFSAGRSHILAVSDSGRIWSWYHTKSAALQIKFAHVEMNETNLSDATDKSSNYGKVRQVVAGWSLSSAYVNGYGIIVWVPVERDHDDDATDTMLVLENVEVPKTGYQRVKDARAESDELRQLGEEVGAVLNYIMLEHFVVFVTDIGKVFCGRFEEKNRVENILELRALRNSKSFAVDVQGSFRRFAVFKNNEVITSDQGYLQECWDQQRDNPDQTGISGLHKIPALQDNDVISVAFGDYHYHALHSNGKITSYGSELQACGALGLGGEIDLEGYARGIVYDRFTHDGGLVPHATARGRQVWFDQKRKEWIHHIMQGGSNPEESDERRELFRTDRSVQGEVSEWIEQEGRAMDQDVIGDDGLGAYFALSISAAGWHSGALVLVNDELANRKSGSESSYEDQTFPRLKLVDGREMPGMKDFDDWKEGRPDWQLDVEA